VSEDTSDLTVTLKAGTGYDVPWIVVRGDNPADVLMKLNGLDDVIAATIDAANKLKAANAVAPIVQGGSVAQATVPEQPQASNGWGSSPAAAQQNVAPQNNGVRYHPEGKLCPSCNAGVIFKEITAKSSGKTFQLWTCPNQRSKGDGHFSEFAN
jgi:hypothetical protein